MKNNDSNVWRMVFALSVFFGFGCLISNSYAQGTIIRDENTSITVCTQNLNMYGRPEEKKKYKKYKRRKEQADELIARFGAVGCDVIALQEVYGQTEKEAKRIITSLVNRANNDLGCDYRFYLARTNDEHIRNGFLIDANKLEVKDFESFDRMILPTFNQYGPTRGFPRGPAGILISSKKTGKKYYILTYHFKSKVDGWKDSSGLNFELFRIENAEGLRQLAVKKHKELGKDVVFIALGDRNAATGAASSEVLAGKLRIEDFKRPCSVNKELEPNCEPMPNHEKEFLALSEERAKQVYSYRYKKNLMMYDEIYIVPEQKKRMQLDDGKLLFGSEGEYHKGSDHLLIWVKAD